ncbi:hypothetical protein CB0940_08236 [Cercospora beticola]|uniref:Uncharacterized protein n=1 Tax=Cercospora beticola TaxID=122368 RepID=A0A2G5HP73_CERBT|nr:hypothetical protein CB0940_08236 [Cercospora beticola]PIA94308.1 hypothetical protein CB0940_08236 [Cercospora beticola]WPB04804.1 hypothetical protein RHO25_009451 [Cercospora beticola]
MAATTKPRARVFRHFKRNQQGQAPVPAFSPIEIVDPDVIKELDPGYAQLYSYYEPGLQGGRYEIKVDHKLNHPDFPSAPKVPKDDKDKFTATQTANPVSTQQFNVNVPRWNLPPGIIHQTYPPQGLADHNNVLPHMVFEDPQFPWENEGSPSQDEADSKVDHDTTTRSRSKVPWVALWTFAEDEIKLSDAELKGVSKGGLFPDVVQIPSHSSPPPDGREQDKATFAVKLTMGEYLEMGGWPSWKTSGPSKVIIPHQDSDTIEHIDREEQVNVVFVKRDIFESHVCSYNADGSDSPSIPPGTTTKPDLSRYKYLSHVRNVNQIAMAGLDLPDKGLYSVVHAHRTGPLNITAPKPVIVHLVSIMDIEENLTLPLDTSLPQTKWVAMISLHSWTYLCLPPDTVNFVDTMRGIGHTIQDGAECWLRAPDNAIAKAAGLQMPKINAAKQSIAKTLDDASEAQKSSLNYRLAARLFDGYSLQRYLLQTGEETVSLYRGPLSPTFVPPIQTRKDGGWWPLQSNFSTDYQVLDPKLGIMDITYSAAWQLGRTLGIADQAFTASLVRLRSAVITTATRETKKQIAGAGNVKSKTQTLATMAKSIDALSAIGDVNAGGNALPTANRVNKLVNPQPQVVIERVSSDDGKPLPPDRDLKAAAKANVVLQHMVVNEATRIAAAAIPAATLATTSTDDGVEVFIPFNEINVPSSPDWQVVQSWILDKLSLHNIPAHYMTSDPSHLPQDSIRFFYIDTNWFDAFIDGALSIGNHLDQEDDTVRQAFKRQLNRYFAAPLGTGNMNYTPQIPTFGFFLRSAVVKTFPNLEVHAPWPTSEEMGGNRMETVRLDCLEKDTLLCLFDRSPGQNHWNKDQGDGSRRRDITICQPPHQQCFRLGTSTTTDYVQMQYRTVYTKDPSDLGDGEEIYTSVGIIKWKPAGPVLQKNADEVTVDFVKQKRIFDYKTNMLIFPAFAQSCIDILNSQMERPNNAEGKSKYFEDDVPSSAVTAVILNSFISVMNIKLPEAAADDKRPAPPDTTKTPRQIRLAPDADSDTTTWRIVPAPEPPEDPRPKPKSPLEPSEIVAPPPLPGPPSKRPTRMPSDYDQANFKFPESEKTDGVAAQLRSPILSQWLCDAFVLGYTKNPAPNTTNNVPIYPPNHKLFNVPLDLIIRIVPPTRIPQDTMHKLQIFSIEVEFLLGNDAKHLMARYDGPGGSMLNNMKWNVHVAQKIDPPRVAFTLIPRSTTKLSALNRNQDLSFAVWGVVTNGVSGGRVKVEPKVTVSLGLKETLCCSDMLFFYIERLANFLVQENYRACDKKQLGGQVQKLTAVSTCDLMKVKV